MHVRITGAGTVTHDGKEYRRGDEIPDITIAHAARLVELGCAEYVAPEAAAEPEAEDAEPEVDTEPDAVIESESAPIHTRPRRGRRARNA